jgi:outer membrane immunogenic protein
MRSHFPAAVLVLALSSASAVNAADYWSGWYAGLNGGYLYSASNAINAEGAPYVCNPGAGPGCTASPNFAELFAIGATGSVPSEFDGFTFGGQVGYNSLFSNWMWGLEADVSLATSTEVSGTYTVVTPAPGFPANPITTTYTATRALDYIGTLRARIGVLFSEQSLGYVTGGFAFGGADLGAAYAQDCTGCTWIPANEPNAAFDMRDTLLGFAIGGGLEFAMDHSWSFKAEYLYYDLGEMVLPLSVGGGASAGPISSYGITTLSNADYDGSVVRVGVNFKF